VTSVPDDPADRPTAPSPAADPVRERRAKIQRLASLGQRIGYLLYAVAIAAFFYGFFVDFNGTVVTIIVATMAVGSAALAPAIVLGYAVKAAERDDLEHGR
jgi:cyanate permease